MNDALEEPRTYRRKEGDESRPSKSDRMKDPVQCGLCSRTLMCPRSKDQEEFLAQKNTQCVSSSDPICVMACSSTGNAIHVERIRKHAANRS
jgi:hypothetical protein